MSKHLEEQCKALLRALQAELSKDQAETPVRLWQAHDLLQNLSLFMVANDIPSDQAHARGYVQ
jgi:hypothetical protein